MESQFTTKEVAVLAQLPQDFIAEILIRLPVKSLLRFKCVSKSFCAIIESKYFIDSHLNKSVEDISHLNLLFPTSEKITMNCNSAELEVSKFQFCRHVHGYCNGIFLLQHYNNLLVLWNPSTQQLRVLPYFPGYENLNNPGCVRVGLGYDSSRDDHKVVVIEPTQSNDPLDIVEYWVWIFEFRSFSWRKVCINFGVRADAWRSNDNRFGHFAHGNLHWLFGDETNSNELVAFDVAKETFSISAKPDYNLVNGGIARLNVLGGSLYMSVFLFVAKLEARLYIRKKDGAEFAWSLLYSVTVEQFPPLSILYIFFEVGILGYSSGGDKIMLDFGVKCVVSYDIKEKSFEPTDIKIPTDICFPARHFVESLVSVAPNKPFVKLFSS